MLYGISLQFLSAEKFDSSENIYLYVYSASASVQNAAARHIFGDPTLRAYHRHLVSIQWLRVPERISYKLAVLT